MGCIITLCGIGRRPRNDDERENGVDGGKRKAVVCSAVGLAEQYRTLRIEPGSSEKEAKRAFKRLALQYHPDVCRGGNCGVQFHRINEAYDLRECEEDDEYGRNGYDNVVEYGDDEMRGMNDSSWELWEEWMGWEWAGIRDCQSHINPCI